MANNIETIKLIVKLGKRELRYTEMKGEKKFDIREWKGDKPLDGARFSEEELLEIYQAIKSNKLNVPVGNKTLIFDIEYSLSMEHNGRTYVRPFATKDEMEKLIEVLECAKDNLLEYDPNAKKEEEAKIDEPAKKRGRPKKNADVENDKQTEQKEKTVQNTKGKIIEFPKEKPEIKKLVTEGNATYEECEDKLNKEKDIFVDADSQYVIVGLLELCKVDSDFRNNVMRKDKNYQGALQYMMDMARKGYAYKVANGYSMDRDMGLMFAIDYFNSKPEVKKGIKANEKIGNAKNESNKKANTRSNKKANS